jgi:hypothetical protein
MDSQKIQQSKDEIKQQTSESQKKSNFGKVPEKQELLGKPCCADEFGNCISC